VVVVDYLSGLAKAAPDIVRRAILSAGPGDPPTWAGMAGLMTELPGFGGTGFMVKEVLQDFILCYPGLFEDELTWTPVGPGARQGLNRIMGRPTTYEQRDEEWLGEVLATQAVSNEQWARWFPKDAPLSAHDIQFGCCEFSKYRKTLLGEGRPRKTYAPHERNGIEVF
jgi:hypothetical protein